MRVLVLGGGVVGVTTAYYLAVHGVDVTVLDRSTGVAMETSYANAGQISPGYSTPWAAPGIPLKAMKWLFQRHAPLTLRPDGSLFQLRWMLGMLGNCTADRYAINKERMMRISEYSRDCLRELRRETGIQYEERSRGTLQLFRSQAQVDSAARDVAVLKECGIDHRLLDRDALASVEPALAGVKEKLTGGLHLPNDETGDCQLFTTRLAEKAVALGVKFRFGESLIGFNSEAGRILGVRVGEEVLHFDRYVLALGSYSREMLLPLGLDIPVYPVKGYSITLPLLDAAAGPVSTILDETYKVAVTRFDKRIRVGGMAGLEGFDLRLNPRRRETLELVVQDLFPGAGDVRQADFWAGLRPMTPDSTPILGATRYPNLFLNTGHGTLGWTMACGSGKLLADLVTEMQPDISIDGLSINRYGRDPAATPQGVLRPLKRAS